MEDSVAAKSKLPTKMFFISSSCLSIVRARLGRFGPRPGCCRTLKRLFKYSRTLPTDWRQRARNRPHPYTREPQNPGRGPSLGMPTSLFYRDIPDLFAAALALGAF